MAKEVDLELPVEKSNTKRLVFIMLLVMVLSITGTAVVMMSLMGGESSLDSPANEALSEPERLEFKEPIFIHLDKLLVNLQGEGRAKLLSANVSLLTYDPAIQKVLDQALPTLRSELNLLLRSQQISALETLEGAEAMRQGAIEKVNALVKKRLSDDAAQIEGLYFTRFVTQ